MKKIVIIGGGTAGWLTALVVNKFWKDINVTIIESSKIGVLGAGEGGTSNFGKILTLLEINHNDFFEKTKSTIKGGLHLYNWTGQNELAKHIFFGELPTNKNKSYAYHFDARLVAEYFKQIAIDRGVNWIDDEVLKINNDKEIIQNLELTNGKVVDLDFVFDCSGFARLIINGVHKEEWDSYNEYLLMNKAITFFLPQTNKYTLADKTYTETHSMKSGWMFKIPLQHRWGCGYVFNDTYISIEDAKKEVENYLGQNVVIQKAFDFKPGTHKRSWIGNSISIGLSYGFIEPLEATSLMSTIMQLRRLININFDYEYKNSYNEWCYQINQQNLMFIRYHYLCERNDTHFWRDAFKMPIPSALKNILDDSNSIIVKNNCELINTMGLKNVEQNELTFFVDNYQAIFKKNKKGFNNKLI